jgi:sugar/nucleoside kinase (ribokinase family)
MLLFDLVGIGNPVYDIIETPTARTDGRVLSGCSTNGCLAAKRLGLKTVGLIGCIGSDYVERFREDMNRYGITANLSAECEETGGFHLIYDEHGDRTLDVLGVAGPITMENFPDKFLDSRFFLIGPILGEVDVQLVEFIRSSSSAKLFLDPQGLVRIIGEDRRVIHHCDRAAFDKIARLVDFIKPNERESETITGARESLAAIHELHRLGDSTSIVTLAERGSLVLEENRLHRIPAFPTRAIDPTGAGDVYAGSFITEYERTGNVVESALFASAAASIMVEQVGPEFQMPLDDVKKRKEAIRDRLVTETVR